MFRIAVGRLKIDPFLFWELTPYELTVIIEGHTEQQGEKRQELLYLAWHIEALARQKRLPALKKILKDSGIKKTKKRLTIEQLFIIAKSKGLKVPDGRW
ncbi:MAG TPA: hypothetical protein DIW17_05690 [Clostridiales bacterium]|nr:hypothetical protein [Clostridiales bacterium]